MPEAEVSAAIVREIAVRHVTVTLSDADVRSRDGLARARGGVGALFTARVRRGGRASGVRCEEATPRATRRNCVRSEPRLRWKAPANVPLDQAPALGDRHQDAEAEAERDHRRAAVADEGQRHAHDRQDAAHHAHVDEGVGEKAERDRAGEQAREDRRRLGGDHQAAKDQEDEAEHQADAADQAELLGERGEDEVGGALGDELEVGLGALHEALAGRAARADRDLALDDVKALAERVGGRVEQRADAVLLVVAHHRPLRRAGRCGLRLCIKFHSIAFPCRQVITWKLRKISEILLHFLLGGRANFPGH